MKRNFVDVIKGLKETINGYDWFVDFSTVLKNIKSLEQELLSLNALIGSENFLQDFRIIFNLNPKISTVIPILIAMRSKQIKVLDGIVRTFDCKSNKNTIEDYVMLLEKTGVKALLENKVISNLYDYVLGVEAGINSNARKNRSGKQMEKLVKSFLSRDIQGTILSQVNSNDIAIELNNSSLINLGLVTKNKKNKRFDFAFEKNGKLYVVECNFYSAQGSKLSATAGQYVELNNKIKNASNVELIWITDGKGWESAQNDLEDAYKVIDHLYTLEDLEAGVIKKL